jgi:hypothetical protein
VLLGGVPVHGVGGALPPGFRAVTSCDASQQRRNQRGRGDPAPSHRQGTLTLLLDVMMHDVMLHRIARERSTKCKRPACRHH